MFCGLNITRKITSEANLLSVSKILQLKPYNQQVKVMGWLKSESKFKERSFLRIDDGSTLQRVQVIVPKSLRPKNLAYHACLCIEGKLVESLGSEQSVELITDKIMVLSPGAPLDYPFVERATYLEEDIRLLPHFRVRTRNFSIFLRVRSQVKRAIRKYFAEEDFINIDTPILTTNNCEGGGEVFSVKGQGEASKDVSIGDGVFGHPVFLTVSGQLHLEAMASGLAKVYNFNPSFRGEKGSRLHLHEFWMVEMEEAFLHGIEGYKTLMDRIECLIKYALSDVMDHSLQDLQFLWKSNKKMEEFENLILKVIQTPFVRLKFKEALEILHENQDKLENPTTISSKNLNKESEIFLTKYFGNIPVFITDWPSSSKPFYMYTEEDIDEDVIAYGMDLLMPFIGEVAGGGLREHRYEVLKKKVKELGAEKHLNWYIELRKFGYASSGGFGLGFERFLQFLIGIDNIQDTIPFPRSNGRCIC